MTSNEYFAYALLGLGIALLVVALYLIAVPLIDRAAKKVLNWIERRLEASIDD